LKTVVLIADEIFSASITWRKPGTH